VNRFRGRRRLVLALAVAVAMLTAGVSVAFAKSGPSKVKVPLNLSSFSTCGLSSKKPSGSVTFTRSKGALTIHTQLHGAFPGKYRVLVGTLVDQYCFAITGFIDTFGVDASGEGSSTKTIIVPVFQSFIIAAVNFDNGAVYQSPVIKLGSN
jgi:hypothetical protein